MKALTKAQIEAIVNEVEERLENSYKNPASIPQRTMNDWKTLNAKIKKWREKEEEVEKLDEKLDDMKRDVDDAKCDLKDEVKNFEKKHNVSVNWEWIDYEDGETPHMEAPKKDLSEKIRRHIAILSIDKKTQMTADELIETIIKKFSQV